MTTVAILCGKNPYFWWDKTIPSYPVSADASRQVQTKPRLCQDDGKVPTAVFCVSFVFVQRMFCSSGGNVCRSMNLLTMSVGLSQV